MLHFARREPIAVNEECARRERVVRASRKLPRIVSREREPGFFRRGGLTSLLDFFRNAAAGARGRLVARGRAAALLGTKGRLRSTHGFAYLGGRRIAQRPSATRTIRAEARHACGALPKPHLWGLAGPGCWCEDRGSQAIKVNPGSEMWLATVCRSGSSVFEVALVGRRALAAHFDAPFDPFAGFWWFVVVELRWRPWPQTRDTIPGPI